MAVSILFAKSQIPQKNTFSYVVKNKSLNLIGHENSANKIYIIAPIIKDILLSDVDRIVRNEINGMITLMAKNLPYLAFFLFPSKYVTVCPQFGQIVPIRDSISCSQ